MTCSPRFVSTPCPHLGVSHVWEHTALTHGCSAMPLLLSLTAFSVLVVKLVESRARAGLLLGGPEGRCGAVAAGPGAFTLCQAREVPCWCPSQRQLLKPLLQVMEVPGSSSTPRSDAPGQVLLSALCPGRGVVGCRKLSLLPQLRARQRRPGRLPHRGFPPTAWSFPLPRGAAALLPALELGSTRGSVTQRPSPSGRTSAARLGRLQREVI